MLVMNFADGGNLHNFLQKNFTKITWEEKLDILWQISYGYLYFNNYMCIISYINLYKYGLVSTFLNFFLQK